jgi:hypothetical protein
MSTEQALQPVDSIAPEALNVFKQEMARRQVDLLEYDLYFYRTDELFVVATDYRKKPKGYRGSVPGHPDYEVHIFRKDNRVKSVSIAR